MAAPAIPRRKRVAGVIPVAAVAIAGTVLVVAGPLVDGRDSGLISQADAINSALTLSQVSNADTVNTHAQRMPYQTMAEAVARNEGIILQSDPVTEPDSPVWVVTISSPAVVSLPSNPMKPDEPVTTPEGLRFTYSVVIDAVSGASIIKYVPVDLLSD